jgi:ABC-type dipeptide/oligopeptide/nickel transport system permease component
MTGFAQALTFRLGRTLLVLLGVVTLTFFLGRLTGDPIAMMLPATATLEDYERIRASLGLDEPLPVQYAVYLRNLAVGDFGTSIVYNRPAASVVQERLPATLELGIPALIFSVTMGIPLGIWCAQHRDSLADRLVMSASLAAQSLPPFLIGILLILLFGVRLGWLPTFGRDSLAHFILPTVVLTLYPLAFILRLTRASMLEVANESYIKTAHAKGLSPRHVTYVHALRNALVPVVTIIGLQIAAVISGSAIVETVFAWPGIGQLAVQSIGGRDYPVIQTIVLLSAAAFGIANTLADIVYTLIDPRIRLVR